MRRALSILGILLEVVAGFLFYTSCLLCFVHDAQMGVDKWWIVLGFAGLALLVLAVGMALNGFRGWRRHAGIVLLSASGITAFLVFTFVCMYLSEASRALMKPETWAFFSDYVSGGGATLGMAVLGLVLFRSKDSTEAGKPAPDLGAAAH